MTEIVLDVRVLEAFFLVKLDTKTRAVAYLDPSVLIDEIFIGDVFSVLNVAVHYLKYAEVRTASSELKRCGVCTRW